MERVRLPWVAALVLGLVAVAVTAHRPPHVAAHHGGGVGIANGEVTVWYPNGPHFVIPGACESIVLNGQAVYDGKRAPFDGWTKLSMDGGTPTTARYSCGLGNTTVWRGNVTLHY